MSPNVIRLGQATDTGLLRRSNEDAVLAMPLPDAAGGPAALYALADGMGGCQEGEVASTLALSALAQYVSARLGGKGGQETAAAAWPQQAERVLRDAVEEANRQVCASRTARQNDMGTTLVALLVGGDRACVVNVGDSRAYLFRGGTLRRLTTDHSLVATMVAAGLITPDEVYTHPQRNIITRSLGARAEVEADAFQIEVRPGDSVLLCSDGLWEMVRDPEIAAVLTTAPDPQSAADALVSLANRNGGADNISVMVVQIAEGQGKTAR